jgi:hypothetical protein
MAGNIGTLYCRARHIESAIPIDALYSTHTCQDGGACCIQKEDYIELSAGTIITDVVAVGKVAIIASDTAYHCGGIPEEPIKGIDRYFNETSHQIWLSVKDGSL